MFQVHKCLRSTNVKCLRMHAHEWMKQEHPRGGTHIAARAKANGVLEQGLASLTSSWMQRAIVDSGASHTYASADAPLENCRPGCGSVTVANGRAEPIVEIGDLGALRNARRVTSFNRTLVGAMDLVDQFGEVRFNRAGVHVVTQPTDGKKVITRIGCPTLNRLFSFDSDSLGRHAAKLGA